MRKRPFHLPVAVAFPAIALMITACGSETAVEPAADPPAVAPVAVEIAKPGEGGELIGTEAPAWDLEGWHYGPEMSLAGLRGRPFLIRFFTNTCPYCASSMPAFQRLYERYEADGLAVMGFYHPKPFGAERSSHDLRAMLDEWGVVFPVALDTEWRTLRRYWLDTEPDGGRRGATSVSFLIDRTGRIRFLHPGPELHPEGVECNLQGGTCVRDFADLESAVRVLLAEE